MRKHLRQTHKAQSLNQNSVFLVTIFQQNFTKFTDITLLTVLSLNFQNN